MGKLTLSELRELRAQKQKELRRRDIAGKTTQIIVGMGERGIGAGAKETMRGFLDAVDKHNLQDSVMVRQTGAMEPAGAEPLVEIVAPDMPTSLYGAVNAEAAEKIVERHIIQKKVVDEYILNSSNSGKTTE